MTERYGFFTDTTTCIGCKACEVACKQWNDLPADDLDLRKPVSYDHTRGLGAATWRHVRFVEVHDDSGALESWEFMSDVCKHCSNAGCLDACPTGAIVRGEHGNVVVQPDICNGCGFCIPACPFGVIDRDVIDGRAAKCTLCHDRLADGLEPACAKSCPTDSIQFGPVEDLRVIAEARVAELHRRGKTDAYLYGADQAGGLGATFLLTQPPETFGLPAQADSPLRTNTAIATATGLAAAGAALAATLLWGRR